MSRTRPRPPVLRQNGAVWRPRTSRPKPGRSWTGNAPIGDARQAETGPVADVPAQAAPVPAGQAPYDPYAPRRRYPWHDDPDYDPTAYRRAPGPTQPTTPQWTPPPSPAPQARPGAGPPTRVGPPDAVVAPAPRRGDDPRRTGPAQPGYAQAGGVYPGSEDPRGRGNDPRAAARTGAHPAAADPPADSDRQAVGVNADGPTQKLPRKITVTRVAAMRSRQFAEGTVRAFHRAATADGADRSGLTALTYATMMTYAVDAAVAVALANTLFFAAAKAESVTNVALYLAITAAPFAVVAPVIGPLLDRIQHGRRAALALTFAGRAALAIVMAFEYHTWLLYPAALGSLVLSKSYVVLKAAVTPRVLPETISLVTTNSRLTTFGLAAGGVFGAFAAGIAYLWGSEGALVFTAALAVAGTVLCLRIPRSVESTAGEVPAALRTTRRGRRTPMGRSVA
ncbi:MAG: hypothetical protein QOH17_1798, partial [Pseudonocardiales bacterium]|nr:hypothetical protein [Pseudonocardiales bacterium]